MDDPVLNPYISPGSVGPAGGGPNLSLKGHVRTGMIITFAMLQGLVFLTAIMLFLTVNRDANAPGAAPGAMPAGGGNWVLPGIGILAFFGACIAAFAIPKMMKRVAIRKFRQHSGGDDSGSSNFGQSNPSTVSTTEADVSLSPQAVGLLGASRAWTIVSQAILEGAAVMNAVLMLVDQQYLHLLPIGILAAGIVIQIPTASKAIALIEEAKRG